MVSHGSFQHIFDDLIKPTREPPSSIPNVLLEPLFMEKNGSVLPTTSNNIDHETTSINGYLSTKQTKHQPCNTGMNAESLSMCTEGLGFESLDDVEHLKDDQKDLIDDHHEGFDHPAEKQAVSETLCGELKRSRIKGKMELPPPISSIGLSGNPWTCLESYRSNGRFILKEVRIPNQEMLHACREDGRLKLQFIQYDDEVLDGDDDDDDEY